MDQQASPKWLRAVSLIATTVGLVGFIGMLFATWAQVLFRKIAVSVDWTEELARVLFITSVFLGIAIAIYERKHIVVDFLFNRLPPRLRALVGVFFNLVILCFLAAFLRGAMRMTEVTWESYMIAMSWMRTGYLYLGECVAIALMMVFVANQLAGGIRDLRTGGSRTASERDS